MCAGAIHTPHLLSLSGIGQANVLRQYGLPVAADLPGVGRNLQVRHQLLCLTVQRMSIERARLSPGQYLVPV